MVLVAPSAVCISDTASPALRTAWFRPRILAVMWAAIASPAASSLAELMRLPVDSCCIATACCRPDVFSAACVYSALTLVLITVMGKLQFLEPGAPQRTEDSFF